MGASGIVKQVVALFLAAACTIASAADPGGRVALPGHTLPREVLADHRVVASDASAQGEDLSITVVLRREDEAGFEQFLADLHDPQSPQFRHFLSPTAVSARFGPSADAWNVVAGYFAAEGFSVVEDSANRMTLVLRGTRAQAERSFAVVLQDHVAGGRRFMANDRDPSLPLGVARHVQAVLGLSDFAGAQRVGVSAVPLWQANPSQVPPRCVQDPKTDFLGIGANICNAFRDRYVGFVGAIYNAFCSLFWNWFGNCKTFTDPTPPPAPPPGGNRVVAADAPPQKIGLAQFDSFRMSDVADWLALVNAPASTINRVSSVAVNGGAPLGENQSEVLLDINAALSMGTNAQVIVYSAPFKGAGSFQALFNRMTNDGVTVISNSWGYCENQTTLADAQSIDAILATAAASGITMFSAAGDTGSTCLNGAPNTIVLPASAPHATAVGGTSITMGPADTYASETWWNGKGGFGVSAFFPRPTFQNGLNGSATRSIPDLSLNADPSAYGVEICQADGGGCPTGLLYGGTSASAPFMAGLMTLVNQSRGGNSGWLNPQIYPLQGTPAFHTPASMGSDFAHVGLGSPNLSRLILALRGGTLGAVSASHSRVTADLPQAPADGTSAIVVAVQLRDAGGFTVTGKTVSLAKSAGSTAVITALNAVTSPANGTALFSVTSLAPETVTFTATNATDGMPLTQTATVTFVGPPAAAASISAFPSSVANNGSATTTITIALQDALGRPAPNKLVTLAQGDGHSIISGPAPATTNASGQISFTATNRFAETVVYTATVVTDGNLAVPGNATVEFSGSPTATCTANPPPQAASGYTLTPFITGFLAEAFFYSNVNFGCAGGQNPAFDAFGVLAANFRTGELFRLPFAGGAVMPGNRIATPGLTIGVPTYGKDGRLYSTRGATGSGIFSGVILELDPVTGATLRTLASNLTCPSSPAVDPLSGDLFYTGTCFGLGSDDPKVHRVVGPGTATPTVVDYATLPGTPNGALSFAPDGTLYVATQYLGVRSIVKVGRTSGPQPAPVSTVNGINSIFWVTVGEALPSGDAKSLIFLDTDNRLKLADISVSPPAVSELINGGISSGTIGPDGCLYTSDSATIYRLAPASGECRFAPTSPAPSLVLSPAELVANPAQGTPVQFTASFANLPVPEGTPVMFRSYGTNSQQLLARTNAMGEASVQYRGRTVGSETLVAEATVNGVDYRSNAVGIEWVAGKHTTFLDLGGSAGAGSAGIASTLRATLTDISATPAVPISGATIHFAAGTQSCNAVTNASGMATCNVTPSTAGAFTIAASYAGSGAFHPAAATQSFVVAGPASTTIASSANPVDVGSPFTLTATVTGNAPTGTVAFRTELEVIPNCAAVPLAGTGGTRTAQCIVNSFNVGSYAVTADYGGDASNGASTATLVQAIDALAGPPCGGFGDIDASSVFCPNVEWLKNRSVTLGCTTGNYCPDPMVFRLQMAAFMNRLGTAGTEHVTMLHAAPGALPLASPSIVCQGADRDIDEAPHRVIVDGIFSGRGSASSGFDAEAVASFDAGATWVPLANPPLAGSVTSAHWGSVKVNGERDLDVGQSVRFGLRVQRGAHAGTGGFTDSRCTLRVRIGNRSAGYAPY